jgi:hypothetical protein
MPHLLAQNLQWRISMHALQLRTDNLTLGVYPTPPMTPIPPALVTAAALG